MDMLKLLLISCCALLASAGTSGVDYYVGNWTNTGVNFTKWAQGKTFHFRDTLTFTVTGLEYVIAVSKNAYESCQWSFPTNFPFFNDKVHNVTVVPLVGDNYYISSVQENCKAGVKLMVTVPEPPVYTPKTYTVGDDKGWALGVDYTKWTDKKHFYFGDEFRFVFNASAHTVVEVWEEAFKYCNETYRLPVIMPGMDHENGSTVVPLVPPVGKHYYISSSSNDCQNGLKVELDIDPSDEAFEPASSPSSRAQSPSGLAGDQASSSFHGATSCFGLTVLLVLAVVV